MVMKHVKKCSISQISRQMQNKIMVKFTELSHIHYDGYQEEKKQPWNNKYW